MKRVITLLLIILTFNFGKAQINTLAGIWEAQLPLVNDSLSIVLYIDNQKDTTIIVLDSPDQFVTDIPIEKCTYINDTLRFSSKSIGASYVGRYSNGQIRGRFTQHGKKAKLTFKPIEKRKLFKRPDTPTPPYPYQEQELSFSYDEALPPINGTLTIPQDRIPQATIVLITGSGWQDRDESLFGHKPFLVIADYLTRNGYAVFRYDDAPLKIFAQQTTFDFAQQVQVILDTLTKIPSLQKSPIGLIGHSEGGLVAWIVGANHSNVDFIVSLAGVGTKMKDVLLYQTYEGGKSIPLSDSQLEINRSINTSLYDIIEKSKNEKAAAKKEEQYFDKLTKGMNDEERKEKHLTNLEIAQLKMQMRSPWFYTIMRIDPSKYLQKITCPVLALNGELDKQVPADATLEALKKELSNSVSVKCVKVAKANHLFQECETGNTNEYGEIEQTIAPTVLKEITKWLESTVKP